MISVAIKIDRTQKTLAEILKHAEALLEFFEHSYSDFSTATKILRELDSSTWSTLNAEKLQVRIKEALLSELLETPYRDDMASISKYAEDALDWTDEDQLKLKNAYSSYLESGLLDDVNDCSSESDLDDLVSDLTSICELCGFDSEWEEVDQKRAELEEPDEDDGDISHWERGDSSPSVSHEDALIELFDGLK